MPICHCLRHQILANRWRPNADRNSQIWLKTPSPLCHKHTKPLPLPNTKPKYTIMAFLVWPTPFTKAIKEFVHSHSLLAKHGNGIRMWDLPKSKQHKNQERINVENAGNAAIPHLTGGHAPEKLPKVVWWIEWRATIRCKSTHTPQSQKCPRQKSPN